MYQVAAILEQASEASEEPPNPEENGLHPLEWKSFHMRAVVAATEDILLFILSEKGLMVRVDFLIINRSRRRERKQIILISYVFALILQNDGIITRDVNGFRSLLQAVKLAPEVWTVMFIRIPLKPETHSFYLDMVSALIMHLSNKFPETFRVCMSRLIHNLAKKKTMDLTIILDDNFSPFNNQFHEF